MLFLLLAWNSRCYIFEYRQNITSNFGIDSFNISENTTDQSLREFLLERNADYLTVVPQFWLDQEAPSPQIQLYISVVFLFICIPGNISQLLVLMAYTRLVNFSCLKTYIIGQKCYYIIAIKIIILVIDFFLFLETASFTLPPTVFCWAC